MRFPPDAVDFSHPSLVLFALFRCWAYRQNWSLRKETQETVATTWAEVITKTGRLFCHSLSVLGILRLF